MKSQRIQKENISITVRILQFSFFGFSLWIEQQTPTPHRPLAVLLNSNLLLFPTISFSQQISFFLTIFFFSPTIFCVASIVFSSKIFFSHRGLLFIPPAQIKRLPKLAVQGLHLPELGRGGAAHQVGHQGGHWPGGRKNYKGEKEKTNLIFKKN